MFVCTLIMLLPGVPKPSGASSVAPTSDVPTYFSICRLPHIEDNVGDGAARRDDHVPAVHHVVAVGRLVKIDGRQAGAFRWDGVVNARRHQVAGIVEGAVRPAHP